MPSSTLIASTATSNSATVKLVICNMAARKDEEKLAKDRDEGCSLRRPQGLKLQPPPLSGLLKDRDEDDKKGCCEAASVIEPSKQDPSTSVKRVPSSLDAMSSLDDLGSSDEVKVFKDEDEVDGSTTASHQAELLAEKSSLIIESEQNKISPSSPRVPDENGRFTEPGCWPMMHPSNGDFGFPSKFLEPGFGMGYLMSPYAAAYANGFTHGGTPMPNDKPSN